jgi:vanillate O-demethylase monooxygenase subunit
VARPLLVDIYEFAGPPLAFQGGVGNHAPIANLPGDRRMPFLNNTWYVAANDHEFDQGLVSRTICNQPIVMFRTGSGEVAALQNRCPHRFVPLSLGKQVNDTLQCGYHGLRFDRAGTCVETPNDDGARNPKSQVRAYPAVERYGVVWIWMGAPEQADPTTIPMFGFMEDPRFAAPRSYCHMKGNYQLIADNLLDLSHVHYLHPGVHDGSDFASFRNEVRLDGETIWSMLWRPRYHLDEARRKLYGFASAEVEGQGHTRWDAPGVLLVHTAFWEHGKSIDDGVELPNAHLLTPETEFTTHYFFSAGRTNQLNDAEADRRVIDNVKAIFETQDGPMIEAQQKALGAATDFLDHGPMILKADAAGVMARRLMKRKIREEAAR